MNHRCEVSLMSVEACVPENTIPFSRISVNLRTVTRTTHSCRLEAVVCLDIIPILIGHTRSNTILVENDLTQPSSCSELHNPHLHTDAQMRFVIRRNSVDNTRKYGRLPGGHVQCLPDHLASITSSLHQSAVCWYSKHKSKYHR